MECHLLYNVNCQVGNHHETKGNCKCKQVDICMFLCNFKIERRVSSNMLVMAEI